MKATAIEFECTLDGDFQFVAVDERLCAWLGRKAEALLGQRLSALAPPEMQSVVLDYERAMAAGGRPWPVVFVAQRQDGVLRSLERLDEPRPGGGYRVRLRTTAGEAASDSALADAQAAQQQAETFLSSIIEAIADPIFVKDDQHRFVLLNGPMCDFLGHPRERLIGRSDYDFFPKEEADVFWQKDDEVFRDGGVVINEERLTDAAGVQHVIVTKKTTFTDARGRPTLVGVIRDMTEQVLALDAAREAARAKSVFVATMSHEIRTPLNGVIGLADMLLTTALDEQQLEFARLIKRSGTALLGVVSDVLDLAKIESGRLELEDEAFDVQALAHDCADLFRFEAERRGLKLGVHIAPDAPAGARGDAGRIKQVLMNLLANAIKFTPEGSITVRLESVEGGVRFSVIDTGIGIDPAHRSRLFEPFTQADASTARQFGGSGLGLSICHHLCRAMGGSIEVDGTPGGGSTFRFDLPLVVLAKAPVVEPERDKISFDLPRHRVLLVEDNLVNQRVGRRMLEMLGQEVDLAEGGRAAIGAMERSRYHLVLMDCHMPDLDGFETTRRIRAAGGWRGRVPIIALTADAVVGTREACAEAGMNDYLSKPISLARLATMLEEWLT
ncbi:MAG: response regulator [Myxococcales bacterium]|nr:response regulator [Myxococcales bacterium]